MNFKIDPTIFEQFPDVLIGVVVANGIDNHGEEKELLDILRDEEAKLPQKFEGVPVTEHPLIASWRETYRKFGAKPKDYPSSIENLSRRILKGDSVRHINKLVDLYNVISLRYLLPVGSEDLSKVLGDVELTIAGEDEKAITLLGEKESRAPHTGEVIYKDDNGAICRRWNWKEADRTKLTEETKNCILVVEALPPVTEDELKNATSDLAGLVSKYCGGNTTVHIMSKNNSSISLG